MTTTTPPEPGYPEHPECPVCGRRHERYRVALWPADQPEDTWADYADLDELQKRAMDGDR